MNAPTLRKDEFTTAAKAATPPGAPDPVPAGQPRQSPLAQSRVALPAGRAAVRPASACA